MKKKALIVTYYWPPAGGSGVQRWLKFSKYLRDFGWEPVIYTSLNPESPAYDDALLAEVPKDVEVIRRSVWEPYSLFRKITGRKEQKFGAGLASSGRSKHSFLNDLAIWIRGNFFIPDARMFWINPSARFLIKYLKENPVDLIISTGPPHSTHLIAKRVSKEIHIPWVADFRDPWTNIDFFLDLKPTFIAKAIQRRLEKSVLTKADKIITVTNGWGKDLISLGAKNLVVIENGFDEADFNENNVSVDNGFTLTHIGTLSPNRNCNALWVAFGEMVRSNQDFAKQFKLRFVGSVDSSAIDSLKSNGLENYCEFLGYLPHKEAIELQLKSQALLLLVNNSPNALGIQTGKVFEYMAARRPILAVGPVGGDTESLINETNAGLFLPFDNDELLNKGIEKFWEWFLEHWKGFSSKSVEKYSRRELTRKLSEVLNEVVNT